MNNNVVCNFSNNIKCSYGIKKTESGSLHTLTCLLHEIIVQVCGSKPLMGYCVKHCTTK